MSNLEHGLLIIDKDKNITSHDVVDIARKSLKTRRIGHIGTLDPHATGVLVLCVNKATKLVKFFTENNKTYEAEIIIGQATDSDDITGKVIEEKDASHLQEIVVLDNLMSFLGESLQTPPKFSAIKMNGLKLYELARQNKDIRHIEPRKINIYEIKDFKVLEKGKLFKFQVTLRVSKGTYIRSIARDLGEKLGLCGTLGNLRRTAIESFNIKDAYSIEQLKLSDVTLIDPFKYLDMQKLVVDERAKSYIENGRFLDLDLFKEKTETIIYSNEGQVLAIYYYDKEKDVMRMSVKWC
ncbi:tRNA pseudouridine(55) synthase TruB [Hujiaoplasma nucleasis]|uniref:tRNA pseudouridine synthase B n=1 Tax=Hujiaoplasma nucleasis TaxID=2725268 RepID=A0A7L6N3H1_9MOLU|nr:tRNA pseudouridine(55) synthase TruB [Hujiaoplasma nucleasis]QLY39605.1 tRNA pseudouridine(55) synthase TruB [Hujiaoplasma nucleasis]